MLELEPGTQLGNLPPSQLLLLKNLVLQLLNALFQHIQMRAAVLLQLTALPFPLLDLILQNLHFFFQLLLHLLVFCLQLHEFILLDLNIPFLLQNLVELRLYGAVLHVVLVDQNPDLLLILLDLHLQLLYLVLVPLLTFQTHVVEVLPHFIKLGLKH